MNRHLHAALLYASRGIAVLPLHSVTDGQCSCAHDCHSPGKHPRTPDGVKGASTDGETIRGWWARWPTAWVGIATGTGAGGVWVLDVDTHAPVGGGLTGPEAIALLEHEHGALPSTARVLTGSGGLHLWWRMPPGRTPPKNRVAIELQGQRVGLDVRSTGGYVVAPPSGHYSGGRYEWEDASPIAEAPGWLCDLVAPVETPRTPYTPPEQVYGATLDREQRYARSVLHGSARAIAALQPGMRHGGALAQARTVGGYLRLLDPAEAEEVLTQAALSCGLDEREARSVVRAGLAHGAASPLEVPDRPMAMAPRVQRAEPVMPDDDRWAAPWPEPPEEVRPTGGEQRPTAPPPAPAVAERPKIITTGHQLWELVAAAWEAVLRLGGLYQRDGQVVRVQRGEHGLQIAPMSEGAMSLLVSQSSDWYSLRAPKKGEVTVGGMVEQPLQAIPRPVIEAMVGTPSDRLPVLDGVAEGPVLSAGGELVASPGYHPGARLWYGGPAVVPERMTEQAAVDLLLGEWLGDVCFASRADQAHALGLLVQLMARRTIGAACPIHVVEAPVQGSGKDLLVQVLGMVGCGGAPVVQPWATSPEERQKTLLAAMVGGGGLLWIGNVGGYLADPTLAALLTAHPVYEQRRLGQTGMARVSTAGLSVVATVNNARLDADIATRAIRIRLDTGMEDPTQRRSFRHPDLAGWTASNRARLWSAAYTLWRAAQTAGEWTGAIHGRYPAWSRAVGRVVDAAGLGAYWLAHRAEAQVLGDAEGAEWRALVTAWAARGGQRTTAGELATYCASHELLLGVLGDGRGTAAARGLARALTGRRGQVWDVDGVRWRLSAPTAIHGRAAWVMECMEPDAVPDMAARRRRTWTEGELWATEA